MDDEAERKRRAEFERMLQAHPGMSDFFRRCESLRASFVNNLSELYGQAFTLEEAASGEPERLVYDPALGDDERVALTIDAKLLDLYADGLLLLSIARGAGYESRAALESRAAEGETAAAVSLEWYRVFLVGLANVYVAAVLPTKLCDALEELCREAVYAVGNYFGEAGGLMSKAINFPRPSDQVRAVRGRHATPNLRKRLAAFSPPPAPPHSAPGGDLDRGLDSLLTALLGEHPKLSDDVLMSRARRPAVMKAAGLSEEKMREAISDAGMSFPEWKKFYFPLVVARVRKRLKEEGENLMPVSPK